MNDVTWSVASSMCGIIFIGVFIFIFITDTRLFSFASVSVYFIICLLQSLFASTSVYFIIRLLQFPFASISVLLHYSFSLISVRFNFRLVQFLFNSIFIASISVYFNFVFSRFSYSLSN